MVVLAHITSMRMISTVSPRSQTEKERTARHPSYRQRTLLCCSAGRDPQERVMLLDSVILQRWPAATACNCRVLAQGATTSTCGSGLWKQPSQHDRIVLK